MAIPEPLRPLPVVPLPSFLLPLLDNCGATTRNRPVPRKADEEDTDPMLAPTTCRAEEDGANALLGPGSMVSATARPRPRPTRGQSSSRRRVGIFLLLFLVENEKALSERRHGLRNNDTLGRDNAAQETMAICFSIACRCSINYFASTCGLDGGTGGSDNDARRSLDITFIFSQHASASQKQRRP
mmetsp:Transcript_14666/g.42204  ORF Transcript_14666/g.42204 Transcript_14666/m.42204 type:complete len:185 (-) Transcript_14666:3337-3891(-)